MARHANAIGMGYARAAALFLAVFAVAAGGIWLSMEPLDSAAAEDQGGMPPQAQQPSTPTPTPTPTPTSAPPAEPVVFTLVMAGDVLTHATVNRNAELPDGGFDYAPMMENVRPWIENADIALCSLEVPLAPPGTNISAYPVFGAPRDLIPSLKAVGWDGCANANNHSLDRGVPGLTYTIEVMEEYGLGHTGTGRDPEETVTPQFYEVEKDGQVLTIAHISATTFHNDFTDPSQYAASLHALKASEIDAQAAAAREAGADIVVFTPHWGQEYWRNTDGLQRDISATLAAGGNVDVILGGHPHVPQPLELLPGGVGGRGMWVAYSMGNFLSNQDENCCVISTATGLLMRVEITLDPETGAAAVTNVTWTGSTVDTQGRQQLNPIQALVDGERPEGITLSESRIMARWNDLLAQMGEANHDPSAPEPSGAVVTVVPRG